MTSPSRSPNPSLLQDLLPFGVGWTLLMLALTAFWWRSEYLDHRQLALTRTETAFRLQAAYHMSLMEVQGRSRSLEGLQPGGLARTYKWQALDQGDLEGHLTSRQGSAGRGPDDWERLALERLAAGQPQVAEVVQQAGQARLRFMGALRMEPACLACHADRGLATGGLLGGLSLATPVVTYSKVLQEPYKTSILAAFILAWAFVLLAMGRARSRQLRAFSLEQQAGDSLRNSEERLREAQRLANVGYWEHDHQTGRILWSDELYRIFGLPVGGVPPSFDAFMDSVHPEDRVRVAELYQKHLREHDAYQTEYRVVRESGEVRQVIVSCHTEFDPAGTPLRTLGINLDHSDRKRLDEALQANAEAYRLLLETSLDGCLEVDEAGAIRNVNSAYLKLSGYDRTTILGMPAKDLEVPDAPDGGKAQATRVRNLGMDRFETWHRSREGRRIPLQASVTFFPAQGRFLYFLRDLSGEREAQQALVRSEARLANAFRVIPDAILITDLTDGSILDLNPGFEALSGYSRQEALGRSTIEIGLWAELADRAAVVAALAATGQSTAARAPFRKKDGSIFMGEHRSVLVGVGSSACALTLVHDMTELDRLESKLQQRQAVAMEAEAIAAKGQMAAYVAHEINGPLAGIKSSMELIQQAVPLEHPRRPYVELVKREVDRIAGIVRSLYELHRVNPQEVQDVTVADVVQDVASLVASRFRAQRVTLELDLGEPGLRAVLRADLLRQVLFNLLLNAVEASPQGGRVGCRILQAEGDLEIRIDDQGSGIPEGIQEQVWEPGFTTKRNAIQGGLGLGLATSRRLLESLQGSIRFETAPGEGTCFFVRLPLEVKLSTQPYRLS